ncbi:MAG: protein kinase [Acidimicrobiia bacterium]
MPPPLPARYRLEVRLGRDQDIEEWLATDEHLDRPVLIRLLGPDATEKRRTEFLNAVRGAAAVRHPHLEPIFEAEEVSGGAYFVSEWNGGMTLQSRLDAGETMDYQEFAANASGLAGALAALHRAGLLHAAIEAGSILYTVSRPARLGGFGRARRYLVTTAGDVSDLAGVLEQALTGFAPGGPPPSEVVDGVPPEVDRTLQAARRAELNADAFCHALEAIPRPAPPIEVPARSWRTLVLAAVLTVLAAGLIVIGRVLAGDTGVPVVPQPAGTIPTPTEAATTLLPNITAEDQRPPPAIVGAATFDPFGEGGENDQNVGATIDGDVSTTWRTERYRDPMELLKPGVGLTVSLTGSPSTLEIVAISAGADLSIRWSTGRPDDPGGWEVIATGRTEGGPVTFQLPERSGGNWLLWFTSLPRQSDGDYWISIGEIRFHA